MLLLENLSEAEKELLLELLEREQSELPVEIRHTRNSSMREELHGRAKLVRGLLDRMRMPIQI
ncbi:MAG TPA: hypothetical protein VIH42_15520 [Thermoguttaceae bacterium]